MYLDRADAARIHEATLTVLERTGIGLDHPEVERQLLEGGAEKDAQGRLLIPREMVTRALEGVARRFELSNRDGVLAFEVGQGSTLFGPGSDALYQVDPESGAVRESRLEDVARNARLADALGFDFAMSMALPRELVPTQLYPAVFAELLRHTARPIVATAISAEDIRHIHALAAIAAGGRKALAARPSFVAYLEPMSPLRFDRVSVDKLRYCAQNEIPFVFAGGANLGSAAPITPEGGVVQGSAESLAGLVIAQLQGAPVRFVYGANTSSADMRSALVCYGAPEWTRTSAMYADLGGFYDLPAWGTAGCSDAQRLDAQAAWEACRGILVALQSGSTLVHDMGYMALGEQFDPRMLVLCAEVLREARHIFKPADLSASSLSLEVIDEVARGDGLYLAHVDTARRFRDQLFLSDLVNRSKIGDPGEAIERKLAARVEALLSAQPRSAALDPARSAAIDDYLTSIPTG